MYDCTFNVFSRAILFFNLILNSALQHWQVQVSPVVYRIKYPSRKGACLLGLSLIFETEGSVPNTVPS
jgi:hypothetical protein